MGLLLGRGRPYVPAVAAALLLDRYAGGFVFRRVFRADKQRPVGAERHPDALAGGPVEQFFRVGWARAPPSVAQRPDGIYTDGSDPNAIAAPPTTRGATG